MTRPELDAETILRAALADDSLGNPEYIDASELDEVIVDAHINWRRLVRMIRNAAFLEAAEMAEKVANAAARECRREVERGEAPGDVAKDAAARFAALRDLAETLRVEAKET